METQLAVLGGGPGGYTAAFEAADRGQRVILIEDNAAGLGGECLHHGCIPSKALLHATALIRDAQASAQLRGIAFGPPAVDLAQFRRWKDGIISRMAQGLASLAHRRGVEVVYGRGRFEDARTLLVETARGPQAIRFELALIAVGSRPVLPTAFAVSDPRIMTSRQALALEEIPKALLVIGGGYVGFELGTVYATLGSAVSLVEATAAFLPGVDADLAQPVLRTARRLFASLRLGTTVERLSISGGRVTATLRHGDGASEEPYDRVLVAVGRSPNAEGLGLERARVEQDARGFITVNGRHQTAAPAIYAIGDVTGSPLLAHKAAHQARAVVEAMCGEPGTQAREAEACVVPAVVFTDPEIAWCGLTEQDARARQVPVQVATFPWAASGRAATLDRPDGLTKLLVEPGSGRILGMGIVGVGAGELIGEGVLAIAQGATAKDLTRAIHPHPTLSETISECAETLYGFTPHVLTGRSSPRRT